MRMKEGKETWHRLLQWDRGQAPAERLAAIILANEGFQNVDPSHPLGGKDGLKDMVLTAGGELWIGAVFFPRGQQSFTEIRTKFEHDLAGVHENGAKGIAFITNQELRLSERKTLLEIDSNIDVLVYHLERTASLLNSPEYYGVRMEFLDIEMSKEEQLAFFAVNSKRMSKIEASIEQLSIGLEEYKAIQKKPELEQSVENDDDDYCDEPRSVDEIAEEVGKLLDKVWFNRHLNLRYKVEKGKEKVDPEIWKGALASAEKVIKKYGEKNLGPYSNFEWGMLNGKLSALRWVLGDEWDMLDT